MVTSSSPAAVDLVLPVSILGASEKLMADYDDLVQRSTAFAIAVADQVRGNPDAVSDLIHQLTLPTKVVFQRWNLQILYMLSLEHEMRYSQIHEFVHGISNRSLSLKLDEMEDAGLLQRKVSQDKPPHVSYSLTERGQTLSRLSFPMVIHLNMMGLEHQLRDHPASRAPQ